MRRCSGPGPPRCPPQPRRSPLRFWPPAPNAATRPGASAKRHASEADIIPKGEAYASPRAAGIGPTGRRLRRDAPHLLQLLGHVGARGIGMVAEDVRHQVL